MLSSIARRGERIAAQWSCPAHGIPACECTRAGGTILAAQRAVPGDRAALVSHALTAARHFGHGRDGASATARASTASAKARGLATRADGRVTGSLVRAPHTASDADGRTLARVVRAVAHADGAMLSRLGMSRELDRLRAEHARATGKRRRILRARIGLLTRELARR